MTDLLTALAEKFGDKTALVDDRPDGTLIQWSFAELEANANRLSRVYQDVGIKVTLINSLLRIDRIGILRIPRTFPAFTRALPVNARARHAPHAWKMVVLPCTTQEGLINQTFLLGRRWVR